MAITRKKLPYRRTPEIRAYEEAVKCGMKNQHVVKSDGGWAVKSGGAERAPKTFARQDKAIEHASKIARTKHSDVIIHGKDGRIRERRPGGK